MSRWITVANRLPFTLSTSSDSTGEKISASAGGLVSSLNGVKTKGEKIWIGSAPNGLTPENWPRIRGRLPGTSPSRSEHGGHAGWRHHPVFIPSDLYDTYYNSCCNDVLWPLLHYETGLVDFNEAAWATYREVNERIADEIVAVAGPNDLVWVHDFHLFLTPKFIRRKRPDLRIGFFLHVPFPSSEVFRQIPAREEILDSLLHSDLVGFHDYSYLRHFTSCLLRLLGIESGFLSVRRGSHVTRLGVFPVSIDVDQFQRRRRDPKVVALARQLEKPHFLFLGVDRLDYIKGLDLKLKAFRTLLRKFPQYRGKVALLQVAVPTRAGVPVYARLAEEVARLVGEINGEFSTPNWTPVHYIHSSISNEQLIALYKAADALIVSSKRDGMNLVALEYVASQDNDRPGVVLLSEFAGALSTLSHTLSINPWDLDDASRKMQIAMEMPKQEKAFRLKTMQDHLARYTSTDWANSFIAELGKTPAELSSGPTAVSVEPAIIESVRHKILSLAPVRVVLFLDYDGTLVPIEATPERATIPAQTKRELQRLARYPWLDTIIVSGRDSRFLANQFEDLHIHLVAEHGAKSFNPATQRWQRRIHRNRSVWYPTASKIISDYTARVPHSQIEKKTFAIAWHYRQSPPEYAEFQARKLAEELELGLANLPVSILRGKKVIEVRAIEADKGVFANAYLENAPPGTVSLGFGDDRTDEDLFQAIRGRGFSFKVGNGASSADFGLESQAQLLPFLRRLFAAIDVSLKPPGAGSRHAPALEKNGLDITLD